MNELSALVIGSSGLIGNFVLEELLKDDQYSKVRILVRRQLKLQHTKLQQELVNFDDINDYKSKFGKGDAIFCCVGTTLKKVKGDKIKYIKIDFDIAVNAAKIGNSAGYPKYLLVSSLGANSASSNFYLQLKGKTEDAIKQFPFKDIFIFRPSLLLGSRNESRPGEKIMQTIMKGISFLFQGRMKRYRAIQAKSVALAMVSASKKDTPGIHTLEYEKIMKLII